MKRNVGEKHKKAEKMRQKQGFCAPSRGGSRGAFSAVLQEVSSAFGRTGRFFRRMAKKPNFGVKKRPKIKIFCKHDKNRKKLWKTS